MKGLMVMAALAASVASAGPLPLWEEGTMPGAATARAERTDAHGGIWDVSVPTLEFLPAPNPGGKPLPTVLVVPGGGYQMVSYANEGKGPAAWLNARGVNAAILKYRVPGDRPAALRDALRALELLRQNAAAWHVDAKRLGMMGFSAGAHLTASVLAKPDHGLACAMLIYPAYLSKDGAALAPEVVPYDPSVPTFLTQCADDRAYVLSSLAYAGHLLKAGRPVDYHLYATGGHGFSFHPAAGRPYAQWLAELEAWLKAQGMR